MVGIFVRTLVVYVILMAGMRLMGKRQIGELEVSDLITTLLLSEIATLPIENPDVPVLHAVIPIVTLVTIEVIVAVVLCRCPRLRQRMEAPPSILICRGKLDQSQLSRNRMSVEELFAGLRQQGISDPSEAEYVIMEKNGKLSVIPKQAHRNATVGDVDGETVERGMMHMIVSDGAVNKTNMSLLGRDGKWLSGVLEEHGLMLPELCYLMCNDVGEVIFQKKEVRP